MVTLSVVVSRFENLGKIGKIQLFSYGVCVTDCCHEFADISRRECAHEGRFGIPLSLTVHFCMVVMRSMERAGKGIFGVPRHAEKRAELRLC